MLVSSSLMIRDRKPVLSKTNNKNAYERNIIIILEGLIVGQLTGFVGAGGGFLIIPALVLLTGLSMNIAVATSLFIIAIKSLMGYLSDVIDGFQTDWMFVFYVCLFTLVGVFVGRRNKARNNDVLGNKLRKAEKLAKKYLSEAQKQLGSDTDLNANVTLPMR